MLSYNEAILTILRLRQPDWFLEGYYGGVFSTDETKFFALTYRRIDEEDWEEAYLFNNYVELCDGGYMSTGVEDDELRIYLDGGSYRHKGLEQCIQEGIYTAYSVTFRGILHEQRWFILSSITFFGNQMDEAKALEYKKDVLQWPELFDTGGYAAPVPSIFPPTGKAFRNVEYEEFPGEPEIVCIIKVDEKTKLNRAYVHYMNVAHIAPFFRRLRIERPEEFVELMPMRSKDFTMAFPEDKRFFLVVAMAKHATLGYRLVWFFFDASDSKFYQWKYPTPQYTDHSYAYWEQVVDDIRISGWDDHSFLDSSCTLDNSAFWEEYVLKQEDGRYIWLEPMMAQSPGVDL